jgi:hypothetical protein
VSINIVHRNSPTDTRLLQIGRTRKRFAGAVSDPIPAHVFLLRKQISLTKTTQLIMPLIARTASGALTVSIVLGAFTPGPLFAQVSVGVAAIVTTLGSAKPSTTRLPVSTVRPDTQLELITPQAPPFPPALHGEQLAYDVARGRLVVFGGAATTDGGKSYVEMFDTWEWDGTRWRKTVSPERGPGSRFGHSMGYDPERRMIVMFGGRRSGPRGEAVPRLCDTWAYNGKGWSHAGAATCVSTRLGANIVHDPVRRVLMLLEGAAPVGTPMRPLRMWRWHQNNWMLVDSAGPRRDVGEQAAFDVARGVLVVPVNRGPDAGVWEWNGHAWTRREATGPVDRNSYGFTYDPTRKRVILIGGEVERAGGRTVYNDVWAWDGVRWTELKTEGTVPQPRQYGTLVVNPATGALYYFGGATESGIPLQEFWELNRNGTWRSLNPPIK